MPSFEIFIFILVYLYLIRSSNAFKTCKNISIYFKGSHLLIYKSSRCVLSILYQYPTSLDARCQCSPTLDRFIKASSHGAICLVRLFYAIVLSSEQYFMNLLIWKEFLVWQAQSLTAKTWLSYVILESSMICLQRVLNLSHIVIFQTSTVSAIPLLLLKQYKCIFMVMVFQRIHIQCIVIV